MSRSQILVCTAAVAIAISSVPFARADSVSYLGGSASAAITVTNGGVKLTATNNGVQELLIFNPPNGVGVSSGNTNVENGEWLTLDFDGFLATEVVLQITPQIPIGPTILVAGFGVGGKPLGQFNAGSVDFVQVSLLFPNQPLSKLSVSAANPSAFDNFAVAGITFTHAFDEASTFLPGQKLHGFVAGFGDVREITFVGQAGSSLLLRASSIETTASVRFQLVKPELEEELSRVVKFGPIQSDVVMAMSQNAVYRLRLESMSNEPGEFTIETLFKLEKEKPLGTLKGKKGGPTQVFTFVAFTGCALDGTLTPNKHVKKPLVVEILDPNGLALNLTPFVTVLNKNGAQFSPMPLEVAGTYQMRVTGLNSTKARAAVKLNIAPPQPAIGDAIFH